AGEQHRTSISTARRPEPMIAEEAAPSNRKKMSLARSVQAEEFAHGPVSRGVAGVGPAADGAAQARPEDAELQAAPRRTPGDVRAAERGGAGRGVRAGLQRRAG